MTSAPRQSKEGTLLLEAAATGNTHALVQLLHEHSDLINYQHPMNGWTALHWATYRQHAPIVQELLATKGVDVELRNSKGERPMDLAKTPVLQKLFGIGTASRMGENDASEGTFVPNYIKYPVLSPELYHIHDKITKSSSSSVPSTSDHASVAVSTIVENSETSAGKRVEILISDKNDQVLGSIYTTTAQTFKEVKQLIQDEIDGLPEGAFKLLKRHLTTKALVPINEKQLEKLTVGDAFPPDHCDALILYIQ